MTASLSDRMAVALRDISNINDVGARAMAYIAAGIFLHELPRDDVRASILAFPPLELPGLRPRPFSRPVSQLRRMRSFVVRRGELEHLHPVRESAHTVIV